MQAPPLLPPPPKLTRALAVARADGWVVIAVAAVGLVWLLWERNFVVAGFATGVLLTGVAELRGRSRLIQGKAGGRHWLVAAQCSLLVLIWGYLWYAWNHFDPAALWARLPGFYQKMVLARMVEQGLDPEFDRNFLLQLAYQLACIAISFVTLFYQGGLAIYYQRQARLASPGSNR